MDARIRYGREVNVLKSVDPTWVNELALHPDFSRDILSFSQGVRHLPEEVGFGALLADLGFLYLEDELEHGRTPQFEPTLPGNRLLGLLETPPTDPQTTKKLGDGLIKLAVDSDRLGHEGVIFIDHSVSPGGVIISSYKADV